MELQGELSCYPEPLKLPVLHDMRHRVSFLIAIPDLLVLFQILWSIPLLLSCMIPDCVAQTTMFAPQMRPPISCNPPSPKTYTQYSTTEALDLLTAADLRVINSWKAPESEYRLWLVERPHVRFPNIPKNVEAMVDSPEDLKEGQLKNVKSVPTWEAWEDVWRLWDQRVVLTTARQMC